MVAPTLRSAVLVMNPLVWLINLVLKFLLRLPRVPQKHKTSCSTFNLFALEDISALEELRVSGRKHEPENRRLYRRNL